MKAFKILSIALLSLMTLNSCSDDVYYESEPVYQETWYVEDFRITPNMWKLVGEPGEIGSYYRCVIGGLPLKDSYYDGVVTAYIYFDYDTPDEVQTPLPFTEYFIGRNSKNEEVPYSIQYSYDVAANGTIAFKAYVSDYYTDLFRPGTEDFRVAIVW
ncbi:hypothetical protein [Bacteroides sp. 224]|uniref:hypothetical protein n=1 Tax=Bacteroides sp. 224 TaxID=2302936 RepID=UPI0013D6A032|nr:hypothetical protein [Bacteroides sp. 224]NDV63797.1 hypothetical protein [Bacteroides sp. 224]